MSEPPAAPRQASLRRLREFEVRPNRELGQNFLIDDNILRRHRRRRGAREQTTSCSRWVAGSESSPSTWRRAWRTCTWSRSTARLEPPLRDALDPFANADLHLADALELDFGALAPVPDKVVANLPYGVAATVLLKSIAELPEASLWVAMVQREVADRLAAPAGGKSYGATSVLAQLSADVRFLRKVPRTVFHPVPNVDSALVVLRRTAPAPAAGLVALIHAGFAHRRKALAGSLALAAGAPDDIRAATRAALERIGQPADARAERLAPPDWIRLAAELGEERVGALHPRRI